MKKQSIIGQECERAVSSIEYTVIKRVQSVNNAYKIVKNAGLECEKPDTLKMDRREVSDAVRKELIVILRKEADSLDFVINRAE